MKLQTGLPLVIKWYDYKHIYIYIYMPYADLQSIYTFAGMYKYIILIAFHISGYAHYAHTHYRLNLYNYIILF